MISRSVSIRERMSSGEYAHIALAHRVATNRQRAVRLLGLVSDFETRLVIARAMDDLDQASGWTTRSEVDTWIDLAESVSATIDLAEWRLATIEQQLSRWRRQPSRPE